MEETEYDLRQLFNRIAVDCPARPRVIRNHGETISGGVLTVVSSSAVREGTALRMRSVPAAMSVFIHQPVAGRREVNVAPR